VVQRDGDVGVFASALTAQVALAAAFHEVIDRKEPYGVSEGTIGIACDGIDLITRERDLGVGAEKCGDLLGAGLLDSDLVGAKGGIGCLEFALGFVPGENLLRAAGGGE